MKNWRVKLSSNIMNEYRSYRVAELRRHDDTEIPFDNLEWCEIQATDAEHAAEEYISIFNEEGHYTDRTTEVVVEDLYDDDGENPEGAEDQPRYRRCKVYAEPVIDYTCEEQTDYKFNAK